MREIKWGSLDSLFGGKQTWAIKLEIEAERATQIVQVMAHKKQG